MNNYEDESTIDLKQLFVYILKKWYVMFVCIIVGAGALAVMSLKSTKQDVTSVYVPADYVTEDKIKSYEDSIAKLNQEIESINKSNDYYNETIKSHENKIKELQDIKSDDIAKVQESIVMSMAVIDDAKLNIAKNNARLVAIDWELANNNRLITIVKNRFKTDIPQKNKDLAAKGEGPVPYTSYEEYLDMRAKGVPQSNGVVKQSTKDVVKKGIIGAILGLFVGGVLLLLRYFTNGNLKDMDYLKNGYKVPVLRMIYPYCGKKRCFYNRMIDKMEGYSNPKATEDEEYAVLAGKLNLLAGDSKELVITGIVNSEVLNTTSTKITGAVANKKYSVITVENPAENVVDTETLKAKKVVLVSKKDELATKRLEALIDILKMAECDILGIVLI